jgi:hypothetical protein
VIAAGLSASEASGLVFWQRRLDHQAGKPVQGAAGRMFLNRQSSRQLSRSFDVSPPASIFLLICACNLR